MLDPVESAGRYIGGTRGKGPGSMSRLRRGHQRRPSRAERSVRAARSAASNGARQRNGRRIFFAVANFRTSAPFAHLRDREPVEGHADVLRMPEASAQSDPQPRGRCWSQNSRSEDARSTSAASTSRTESCCSGSLGTTCLPSRPSRTMFHPRRGERRALSFVRRAATRSTRAPQSPSATSLRATTTHTSASAAGTTSCSRSGGTNTSGQGSTTQSGPRRLSHAFGLSLGRG